MTMPNMVIMLMLMPIKFRTKNAIMNEIGIDMPIMMAGRTPKAAMHMIKTSTTAVKTAASSVRYRFLVLTDWSSR